MYHVDLLQHLSCSVLTKSTKGEVGYAALSGRLITKITMLRWWWLGFKGLCKLINL